MCKKDGKRLVHARKYYLLSGYRFLYINVKDESHNELEINITYNGGEFHLEIFNKDNESIYKLDNPETNKYLVNLPLGKNKITIRSKAAIGAYSFYF